MPLAISSDVRVGDCRGLHKLSHLEFMGKCGLRELGLWVVAAARLTKCYAKIALVGWWENDMDNAEGAIPGHHLHHHHHHHHLQHRHQHQHHPVPVPPSLHPFIRSYPSAALVLCTVAIQFHQSHHETFRILYCQRFRANLTVTFFLASTANSIFLAAPSFVWLVVQTPLAYT